MGPRSLLAVALVAVVFAGALATAVMYEPGVAPIEPPKASSFDVGLRERGARVVALGDYAIGKRQRSLPIGGAMLRAQIYV